MRKFTLTEEHIAYALRQAESGACPWTRKQRGSARRRATGGAHLSAGPSGKRSVEGGRAQGLFSSCEWARVSASTIYSMIPDFVIFLGASIIETHTSLNCNLHRSIALQRCYPRLHRPTPVYMGRQVARSHPPVCDLYNASQKPCAFFSSNSLATGMRKGVTHAGNDRASLALAAAV
jgi:hypothetical protein